MLSFPTALEMAKFAAVRKTLEQVQDEVGDKMTAAYKAGDQAAGDKWARSYLNTTQKILEDIDKRVEEHKATSKELDARHERLLSEINETKKNFEQSGARPSSGGSSTTASPKPSGGSGGGSTGGGLVRESAPRAGGGAGGKKALIGGLAGLGMLAGGLIAAKMYSDRKGKR